VTARVWLIAHHSIPWSTGSDLRRTLEGMGVTVRPLQDEDLQGWQTLIEEIKRGEPIDAVIWNATPMLSGRIPAEIRREMQFRAKLAGVPTVAFHLDRWWGLRREPEVYADPFFQCEWVFTADGHPHPWEVLGINHHWLPPGVAPSYCAEPGLARPPYLGCLAFVGSWRRYGHYEWTHREHLVSYLRQTYQAAVAFWPERGQTQVRGNDLTDLYASVDIIIGDSCLLPIDDGPYTRFLSDRIPETLGRGGVLVHPRVEGVTDGSLYTEGEHLRCWTLGDWDELKATIDQLVEHPDQRQALRDAGRAHVAAWHTYDTRMMYVLERVLGRDPLDLGVNLWPTTVEAQRRSDGEADHQTPQASPKVAVRAARKKGVPNARQSPRPQRKGAGKPDVQARPLIEVLAGPDQREGEPGAGEGPQPEPLTG
jgi:hypothetical protein